MTRRIDEESRLSRWSRRKTQARSEGVDQPALKQSGGRASRGAAVPVADADRPVAAKPQQSTVSHVPGAEGPAMPWTPPLAYADEGDDRPVGLYTPIDGEDAISDDDRETAAKMGLPDIETLGPGSDFKPFLKDGVPTVLKRIAMRKLWTSNPAFAVLDGLNDYDENFRVTNVLIDAADTAYKVGKSYFTDDEKPAEEEADEVGEGGETAKVAEADDDRAVKPDSDADGDGADDDDDSDVGDAEDDMV